MEASTLLWLLYTALASCLLYKLFFYGKARRPPGPVPLPLLGNILELQGEPHHALARLAETHGPIMSLRLGTTSAIVASSAAAARDVLQRYDHILAARSVTDAGRALGNHEHSVIWLPGSSPLWKRLRAVCTNHLFSARGLDATRAVREEKVRELVHCLRGHAAGGGPVDVGRVVFSCVLNLVSNALFSEDVADLSSDRAQELEMLVRDTVEEVTKPNLSDLFPVLSKFDLQGRRRRTAGLIGRFYDFFDPIIARRLNPGSGGGEKKEDFLDVLLQLHSVDQLSLQTIKSFLLDLFAAGTDTNAITVEWTMAELLRHPAVMSKVRAELWDALGSKPHPDESDIGRLPYLRAVVMESMRLHPPSPMLMPHEAMADGAEVGGFAVPGGTKVIVNLWAIMRDPASWSEPGAFVPERFGGADQVDFVAKDRLEFMPFGAGRRACPGTPMATRVVTLILASMLHAFEWRLPEGMQPGDVDVRDRFGTSLNMVTPLKAVPVPVTTRP
ncbi:cytochrome P450 76M5-like [Phragmites australis]|uniref:cytochrome P450 76M5-like n=1 Tax=Phragmites australis TaxID=29695 RepID=UPI002D76B02D|nr:cytochrome P450 76M5-like [Phragmites australis]